MGPEAMLISAGLQLVQGFGQYQQSRAQAKAIQRTAEYNIAVDQQRADVEKAQLKRQQQVFAGQQRSRAAGTGATLESFEDVFEDTSSQSLLDLALMDYETKVRRNQTLFEARNQAAQVRSEGRNALISGIGGAASSYNSYRSVPKYESVNWRDAQGRPAGSSIWRSR